MATRVCDVPIDLDDSYNGEDTTFVEDVKISIHEDNQNNNSDSCAASGSGSCGGEDCPSWSSSSGSFYDDLETSPIDMGAKWYWHSAEENGSELGAGYLSRENGFEDKTSIKVDSKCTNDPDAQIFFRSVWNRDTREHSDVMVKRMQSNREIDLLQHLNTPVLRYDPWNPAPPLLSIVNPDNAESDEPLAIFDPLVAWDSKPLTTVEEALDFVMQLLQGLVFLHENRVIHGDIHGKIVMMDQASPQTQAGSRVHCNVRYYLVDFTHASIVDGQNDHLYQEDLRDLGLMIDRALGNSVPELSDIILEMTSLGKSTHDSNDAPSVSQVLENLEHMISGLTPERIKDSLP